MKNTLLCTILTLAFVNVANAGTIEIFNENIDPNSEDMIASLTVTLRNNKTGEKEEKRDLVADLPDAQHPITPLGPKQILSMDIPEDCEVMSSLVNVHLMNEEDLFGRWSRLIPNFPITSTSHHRIILASAEGKFNFRIEEVTR